MNLKDEQLKIIERAVQLYDSGFSIAEILNKFPEHRQELNKIFDQINLLGQIKEKIYPSPALLKKILLSLNKPEQKELFIEKIKNTFDGFKIYKLGLSLLALILLTVSLKNDGVFTQINSPLKEDISKQASATFTAEQISAQIIGDFNAEDFISNSGDTGVQQAVESNNSLQDFNNIINVNEF